MITETLTFNALWMILGVFGVLLIATGIIAALHFAKANINSTELFQRLRSWWIIVIIFTIAISLYQTWALVFLAFISFLSLKEYLSLISTRRADRSVLFWAYWSIPVQYIFVGMGWYGMFIIFIPLYMLFFLSTRLVLTGQTKGYLNAIGTLQWGLMITVFALSHLGYLLILPASKNPLGAGAGLLLFLLFLTESNDVAQYVWGKLLGRHKIIPTVSPNKTWEGFIGGVITTTLFSFVLAPLLTPLTPIESLGAGLILSIAGYFGDVTISSLKRDIGVKDSGSLLPGHGGILDRLDSLTYTSPLFFHFVYYLHY